jgi:hypothetical protein
MESHDRNSRRTFLESTSGKLESRCGCVVASARKRRV